jgi:hypothetical protein
MIRSFSLETARVAPRCDLAVTFGKLRHDRHLSLGLRTLSTHFATYSTMLYVG